MQDTLTVTVEHSVIEALRKESAATGRSEGEIVTEALRARFAGSENGVGLERFFGIMEGPKDLSTNKEYRRHWGRTSP